MLFTRALSAVIICAFAFASRCDAQETKAVSGQLDLDMRARIASKGESRATLYSSELKLQARFAPSFRFLYAGAQNNASLLADAGGRVN